MARTNGSEECEPMMGQKTERGNKAIKSASGSFKAESDGSLGGKVSTGLNMQGHTRETKGQHGDRA